MIIKSILYIFTFISLDVYSSQKDWIEYYSINQQNDISVDLSNEISLLEDSNFKIPTNFTKSDYMRAFSSALRTGKVCKRSRVKVNGKRVNLLEYDQYFKEALESNDITEDCLHKLLTNYLKLKWKEKSPLKSDYCRSNDCLLVKKAMEDFENNLYYISNIVYKKNNTQKLICSKVRENKDLGSIFGLLNDIEEVANCSEIQVGQTRVVNSSQSRVAQRYSIERTSDNAYKLNFVLNFGRDREYDSSSGKEIDSSAMHSRISSCLEGINPFLFGPDGEKIDIQVYDKTSVKTLPEFKRPRAISMDIVEDNVNSEQVKYSASINCPTIIHELLHSTGLHDEYHRSYTGIYVNKNTGERVPPEVAISSRRNEFKFIRYENYCRAIAKKQSIMGGELNNIYNSLKRTYKVCECDSSMGDYKYEECLSNLNKMPKNLKKFISINSTSRDFYDNFPDYFSSHLSPICHINNSSSFKYVFNDNHRLYKGVKRTKDSLYFTKVFSEYEFTTTFRSRFLSSPILSTHEFKCDCKGTNNILCDEFINFHNLVEKGELEIGSSTCPVGMVSREEGIVKKNVEPKVGEGQIVIKSAGTKDFSSNQSFLRKAHFEIIKSGSCEGRARKYRECSKYSRRAGTSACKKRPNYCEDEEKWLDSIK